MNKKNFIVFLICACILVIGMIMTINEVTIAKTNYSCADWIICFVSNQVT